MIALLVAVGPSVARAANYETTNFVVTAPTPALAKQFGDMAEKYRVEKAMDWLGREMPPWPQKCPLQVTINGGGAGGATTFNFGHSGGRSVVVSQQMEIRGDVQQLLYSVLPHEVTHTVLAHHFGRPVPRWADEGGSVLSENENERYEHDLRCRTLLNAGRGIRLKVLFTLAEYPRDISVLYAQGYSITAYLVDRGGGGQAGRAKLLSFLGMGSPGGSQGQHGTGETWNQAAQRVYGFGTVDELEAAWLDAMRTPPSRTAARNAGSGLGTPAGALASAPRTDVRMSGPPALPVLGDPVRARGTAPEVEPTRGTVGFPPAGGSLPPSPAPVLPPTPAPNARPVPTFDPPPPVLGAPEIPRPVRP